MRGGSQDFMSGTGRRWSLISGLWQRVMGLECVSVSARVADAGNLSHVKLVVRGEQNQAGAEIASVRRKIGAYYGVEERDIEVDVEGE